MDLVWEKTKIELTANYDNVTTTLYDGWFILNSYNGPYQTFNYDVSSTGILNDPWGDISITASITPWYNYNDFAITEVGIGGEYTPAPVPEPATILLFGTGLVGLAGAVRRKKKQHCSS